MKIAISLPEEYFIQLEKHKKKSKKNRSEIIQEALQYWMSLQEEKKLITQYEEGYRKKPEKAYNPALTSLQSQTFDQEKW